MTDYHIHLVTRDGRALEFDCPPESDVIGAAETAGVLLPSLCKDGGCGACLATCREGDYHLGACSTSILPDDARARGEVLLCQTYPAGDLKLAAPYDYAHIGFGVQEARPAAITGLAAIAGRTLQLKLQWQNAEAGNGVEFEPGQFMELEIPGTGIRRAYSLANTPNWCGEMEFLIRLQAGGQFCTYLDERAAIGQVLNVYGPVGAFGLSAGSLNPAVFVAGGTGLAPFLSILRRMREWDEDYRVHLLFGVNQEAELFCLDELQGLQAALPGFTFDVCVWKPAGTWPGFTGTPAEALRRYLAVNGSACDLYLCGPPLLVAAATEAARAAGMPDSQVFSEKFG